MAEAELSFSSGRFHPIALLWPCKLLIACISSICVHIFYLLLLVLIYYLLFTSSYLLFTIPSFYFLFTINSSNSSNTSSYLFIYLSIYGHVNFWLDSTPPFVLPFYIVYLLLLVSIYYLPFPIFYYYLLFTLYWTTISNNLFNLYFCRLYFWTVFVQVLFLSCISYRS